MARFLRFPNLPQPIAAVTKSLYELIIGEFAEK
jgi:hypothetical protein